MDGQFLYTRILSRSFRRSGNTVGVEKARRQAQFRGIGLVLAFHPNTRKQVGPAEFLHVLDTLKRIITCRNKHAGGGFGDLLREAIETIPLIIAPGRTAQFSDCDGVPEGGGGVVTRSLERWSEHGRRLLVALDGIGSVATALVRP